MVIDHDEVKLFPYNPKWKADFEKAKDSLLLLLSSNGLHPQIIHIGSTSIVDIPAKPIVDILVLLPSEEEAEETWFKLMQNGFAFLGDGGRVGRYFLSDDTGEFSRYIHVTTEDNQVAKDQLRFQKLLQISTDIRLDYIKVKQQAAELYPDDRIMYRTMKSSFIDGVLRAYEIGMEQSSLNASQQ